MSVYVLKTDPLCLKVRQKVALPNKGYTTVAFYANSKSEIPIMLCLLGTTK